MRRLIITPGQSERTSTDLLSTRIAELGERWRENGIVASDLSRLPLGLSGARLEAYGRSAALANVMSSWNPGRVEFERPVALTPAGADKVLDTSRILAEMAAHEPVLARGPLQRDHQHWVGDGSHIPVVPHKELCVVLRRAPNRTGIPAFWSAFFTSTAMSSGYSMWRALMSCTESDAYGRALPWHTWQMVVDDDVRIAEVESAVEWVDFVCSYGVVEDGILLPDWARIARAFDGVHFTWPLIVAAQGLAFMTDRYVMARSFWDVECTLWLNWRFGGARLVERFDAV